MYKFVEQGPPQGEEGGGKLSGFSFKRVVIVLVLLVVLAAVIGVTVYFTTRGKSDETGKNSGSETAPVVQTTVSVVSKTTITSKTSQPTTTLATTSSPPSSEKLSRRIDCFLEAKGNVENLTKEKCEERKCMYDPQPADGVPECYFSEHVGYKVIGQEDTGFGIRVNLELKGNGPFGREIRKIVMEVEMRHNDILHFKFDDPVFRRFKIPKSPVLPDIKATNPVYELRITQNDTFAFQIIRKSNGRVLWDTSVGGFVFSDQFLQISTVLPSKNIYGFGENLHKSFRHDLNYRTWPMWSRDQPPTWTLNSNLYGVHPFYTCLEDDGKSHGVLLWNSNAQDYSFTPLPMLTYRTIGGILDFYMFFGPEPENVVQQYTQVIGRPFMPPYWSLGFQLCRYGYNSLDNLKAAVNRTKQYNIPHDVQYADIDHMDERQDFTIDNEHFKGLNDYFQALRGGGMRTIIILDPCFISNVTGYEPYDNLTQLEGAVKSPADYNIPKEDQDHTGAVLGYVWPKGKVVFPDFFNPNTEELWKRLIVKHHKEKLVFDALWIDMNEPANFGTNEDRPWNWPEDAKPYWSLKCPESSLDDPPYRTMAAYVHDDMRNGKLARLSDKTLCSIHRQGEKGEYRHYDVHSLYGWSQIPSTLEGARLATGERSMVLSRSTFPGSGHYAGHWLGDNDSQWPDLADSIIGMLEFNLFGIPYIGADICGFWANATVEMCKRWMQLGAFYPFSRNHNGKDNIEQDPGALGPEVAEASREAIETRYWLLPYLYTLFYSAHVDGHTVVRPLFHEFPADNQTYGIDRQFLWGHALMIVPILEQQQQILNFYLPEGYWYSWYTGERFIGPQNRSIPVTSSSKTELFVRGGTCLPLQRPANNTHFSRQNPMKLLVALDSKGQARGELFWDDGKSIDTYKSGMYYLATFKAEMNSLELIINHDRYKESQFFDTIEVFGVEVKVRSVHLDDGTSLNFTFIPETKVLKIMNLTQQLDGAFRVRWRTEIHDEISRIDCYPDCLGRVDNVTKEKCEARKCEYAETNNSAPSCFFPKQDYGYSVAGDREKTELGFRLPLTRKGSSPFSKDIKNIIFEVEMRGDNALRFKFDVANSSERYKVPMTLNLPSHQGLRPRYEVIITSNDTFSFQIRRRGSGAVLWDSSVGGLTFADQFLQIATKLPTFNVYGFGENVHKSFRHDMRHKIWPMFSRDQGVGIEDNNNHYGVHPYYMCMEEDGQAHGVLLLNSNAQDYTFSPLPMLTYRTIGGILDFYMFLGPEPENVVQQYTEAIGRPYMPPYWSLGFQLSRYGYNHIDNLKAAVDRTKAAGIPHDIQYADIDHMDERKDFTVDNGNFQGLNEYFKSLRESGMHTIIILDPALISNETNYAPYDRMKAVNGNIKWPDNYHAPEGSIDSDGSLLGFVWPKGKTVFPDFFNNETQRVWRELIVEHHNHTLIFDGLWIDMNEPASFGTNEERPFNWPADDKPYWSLKCAGTGNNTYELPPYRTMASFVYDDQGTNHKAMLSDKTICMAARQGQNKEYMHYDVHSLYGWSQTLSTLQGLRAATGERGIVISRSTFPGSGKYAGHWLGDNNSSGGNYIYLSLIKAGFSEQMDIITSDSDAANNVTLAMVHDALHLLGCGMLEFNLFGIPYIGADICGFFDNTTSEMCKRWMQLGAFYTFSRNHNGIGYINQDPAALGEEVARASKEVMEIRYWLLPYLYTLFHFAHTQGNTVIRPLHHEFPTDKATYGIDTQFLWGQGLLISPILQEGQTSLSYYLPRGHWYNFYTGVVEISEQGTFRKIPITPESKIPLHVRGGYILPLQAPANNTEYSRKNPFKLLVALEDSENTGRGMVADGHLFWDDGDSVDTYENDKYYFARFKFQSNRLTMAIDENRMADPAFAYLYINTVQIMGMKQKTKYIYVNDTLHTNFTSDMETKVLLIKNLKLFLSQEFTVELSEYRHPNETEAMRIDCFPDIDDRMNKEAETECKMRQCIFSPVEDAFNIPKCYMNMLAHGYRKSHGTSIESVLQNNTLQKRNTEASMFGQGIDQIHLIIEGLSNQVVHFKITDTQRSRYEVPIPLQNVNGPTDNPLYNAADNGDPDSGFYFRIRRASTKIVLWNTDVGGLSYADQFLQIATKLPSKNIYGFGENRHFGLRHDLQYRRWPMFSRDNFVNAGDYANLYGVHPFYMCIEDDGNAHGVLLLNSNAMDPHKSIFLGRSFIYMPQEIHMAKSMLKPFHVSLLEILLQPLPSLVYRTLGGVLDFYMFMGPTPEEVIQQYTQLIGYPYFPPYWSLGFQLCRYGYNNLSNLMDAVSRTVNARIPLDVQYADIDHMHERMDFTIDKVNFGHLPDYVRQLKAEGIHFIIILDPALDSEVANYSAYERGFQKDIFIKWPRGTSPDSIYANNTDVMLGYVWPNGKVAFPDFFHPDARDYWSELIVEHHKIIEFDGLWIDMNEPANFGTNEEKPWNWPANKAPWSLKCPITNSSLDHPPYKPRGVYGMYLSDKTLCMVALQGKNGIHQHYDVHSLYGWSQTEPTLKSQNITPGLLFILTDKSSPFGNCTHPDLPLHNVQADMGLCSLLGVISKTNKNDPHLMVHYATADHSHCCLELDLTYKGLQDATGKRGMVISRSTYPSSGRHTGHWLGDNDSKWSNLHDSIIGIIEFNLFGIPYVGADICGFNGDTNAELCQRWMQLGAFYTFSRNHNAINQRVQDPAAFGPAVAESSRQVLETRYLLLPYLYTLFYHAHTRGGTIIRSMLHEFPKDRRTWDIDTQFLWGPSLLIAPVLEQGKMTKDVYFPEGRWFDYYSGNEIRVKRMMTVNAPRDFLPLYIRGGYILPTQDAANNTVHSRKNPLGLIIAPDMNNKSEGDLYWDDGENKVTNGSQEYILTKFNFSMNSLQATVTHNSYTDRDDLRFQTIWVYGVPKKPENITNNGNSMIAFIYYAEMKMLYLFNLSYPLNSSFSLSWS